MSFCFPAIGRVAHAPGRRLGKGKTISSGYSGTRSEGISNRKYEIVGEALQLLQTDTSTMALAVEIGRAHV